MQRVWSARGRSERVSHLDVSFSVIDQCLIKVGNYRCHSNTVNPSSQSQGRFQRRRMYFFFLFFFPICNLILVVSGMARFARGNIRFNFADMQEKYKKHCQQLFDLQNQLVCLNYLRYFFSCFNLFLFQGHLLTQRLCPQTKEVQEKTLTTSNGHPSWKK